MRCLWELPLKQFQTCQAVLGRLRSQGWLAAELLVHTPTCGPGQEAVQGYESQEPPVGPMLRAHPEAGAAAWGAWYPERSLKAQQSQCPPHQAALLTEMRELLGFRDEQDGSDTEK